MPKSKIASNFIRFTVWLTGVLVSLAVGFGMINKVLTIPLISDFSNGIITEIAGVVVVVFTLISVVLSAVNNLGK
ncbi:MAG: hypothetical protein WC867_01200 [Candidatus Pacearchaeota archaeon]